MTAVEFMLGWDYIAPLKALSWASHSANSKHKEADRLAAASEAFHVVGWSRTDMVKALGIKVRPLREDPLPPNGFAPWEPWPPQAAENLFMERFYELARVSRSRMSPSRTPRFGHAATPPAPFQGDDHVATA